MGLGVEQTASYPSGQRGQTVNLLPSGFVGSNPTLATGGFWICNIEFELRFEQKLVSSGGKWESKIAIEFERGCSSMVELLPSKQVTRVRFPSPA